MKSILLAAAAVLFVAAPAVAQQALSGPPTILVTGSGEAEAQPDQFTISLNIMGRGATQIEALQSMAAIQNRMMETLPALGGLTRSGITTGNTALETVQRTCTSYSLTHSLPWGASLTPEENKNP